MRNRISHQLLIGLVLQVVHGGHLEVGQERGNVMPLGVFIPLVGAEKVVARVPH